MVALGGIVMRILLPAGAIGVAHLAADRNWGVFNQLPILGWYSVPISILILDFFIYFQHRLFHVVPTLWRLHRMHHTDLDFDTTTGIRFHPLEFALSLGIKCVVILAIGASPLSVLIFEISLNASSLFNHSNLDLNPALDRWLRFVVVTPDMHRVHHSSIPVETHSNFGFNFPWWDRVFGTYTAQPKFGHHDMEIGLKEFRDPAKLKFGSLLIQPFSAER